MSVSTEPTDRSIEREGVPSVVGLDLARGPDFRVMSLWYARTIVATFRRPSGVKSGVKPRASATRGA